MCSREHGDSSGTTCCQKAQGCKFVSTLVCLWSLNPFLHARREDPLPRLEEVRPSLGPEWQDFFDQLLHKDPAHRLASAAAMRDALLQLQRTTGTATAEDIAAMLDEGEELLLDDDSSEILAHPDDEPVVPRAIRELAPPMAEPPPPDDIPADPEPPAEAG